MFADSDIELSPAIKDGLKGRMVEYFNDVYCNECRSCEGHGLECSKRGNDE